MTARSGMTPFEGARPQLAGGDRPAGEGRGAVRAAVRLARPGRCAARSSAAGDLQKQIDVLWQVSERETGVPLDVVPGRLAPHWSGNGG